MLLLATIFVGSAWSAEAADIELRGDVVVSGTIVRLGDIAELRADDAQLDAEWKALPLFPAPAIGRTRLVKQQELAQLLAFNDERLANCRVVGARAVQIRSTDAQAVPQPAVAQAGYHPFPTDRPAITKAVQGSQPATQHSASPIAVSDSHPATTSEVQAVVALRRLERGEVIRREDVALRPIPQEQVESGTLVDLNAVIGREATQMVNPSSAISAKMVQKPRLVLRGETVTVRSIAAGIRVTTSGKAREDGSEGSLVQVELDDTHERIAARVVGVQQVEVYAGGPRVATQRSIPSAAAQQ